MCDVCVNVYCSALLEAQEIFGLDFDDPNEFARIEDEGLASEEEEEEEEEDDVRCVLYSTGLWWW